MIEKIKEFVYGANLYHKNARHLISEDRAKAGEMLRGAFAQKIRAVVASKYGRVPSKHSQYSKAYEEIANDLKDKELFDGGRAAEQLHANFYERFMKDEPFRDAFKIAESALTKLKRMLPRL